jgi:hypothetical protein
MYSFYTEFKFFMHKEIKSRLNMENICHNQVHLSPSRVLSKNSNIKIYVIKIFLFYVCKQNSVPYIMRSRRNIEVKRTA